MQSETVEMKHGRVARGVEILAVIPGGVPQQRLVWQGSSPGALRTTVLFIGYGCRGGLVPARDLRVALSKIGEPHETIIAVDGERTRDVTEFEEASKRPTLARWCTCHRCQQRPA